MTTHVAFLVPTNPVLAAIANHPGGGVDEDGQVRRDGFYLRSEGFEFLDLLALLFKRVIDQRFILPDDTHQIRVVRNGRQCLSAGSSHEDHLKPMFLGLGELSIRRVAPHRPRPDAVVPGVNKMMPTVVDAFVDPRLRHAPAGQHEERFFGVVAMKDAALPIDVWDTFLVGCLNSRVLSIRQRSQEEHKVAEGGDHAPFQVQIAGAFAMKW